MIILYIISAISILLGIAIRVFKWGFLISGYNTMSKEKKANVDKEGLCKSAGNFIILIGLLILIGGIASDYGYKLITTISMLSILPLTLIIIIKAQKYDHNPRTKSDKIVIIVVIIFTLMIIIFVAIMLMAGTQEPKVDIEDIRIKVSSGIYKSSIDIDSIIDIRLEEKIPKVAQKINGFDLGYILRGKFRLEDIGIGKIYIHENKSPYLVIKTQDDFYIINYKDSKETIELYERVKKLY